MSNHLTENNKNRLITAVVFQSVVVFILLLFWARNMFGSVISGQRSTAGMTKWTIEDTLKALLFLAGITGVILTGVTLNDFVVGNIVDA